jgi:dihydrofolate synthase/folylpolyglutamate synthase
MMNYKKSLEYLYSFEKFGIKYNLENITRILNSLGNPQRNFKSFHIAGTNGKGTVAAMINSLLAESGHSTGLYTSPHILDFRERINIGGKVISGQYVTKFLNEYKPLFDKIKPTFFEITTSLAFKYFSDKKVEFAVIETGLGGRFDSTNVIVPEASIITGISYDHMQYLGDTLEKIASEKAGIIKKNIPVIHTKMKKNISDVISEKAGEMKAEEIISDKIIKLEIKKSSHRGMTFDLFTKENTVRNISTPLTGSYNKSNFANALAAFIQVYPKPDAKIIRNGFKNVISNSGFHGRFETISKKPAMILDVAHNPDAITNLINNLKSLNCRKLYIVFGMMKDKDYGKCISMIEKLDAEIILTHPAYERAAMPQELLAKAKNKNKFVIRYEVREAAEYALAKARKSDAVLAAGSFFLISDFLKAINFKYF